MPEIMEMVENVLVVRGDARFQEHVPHSPFPTHSPPLLSFWTGGGEARDRGQKIHESLSGCYCHTYIFSESKKFSGDAERMGGHLVNTIFP